MAQAFFPGTKGFFPGALSHKHTLITSLVDAYFITAASFDTVILFPPMAAQQVRSAAFTEYYSGRSLYNPYPE